MKRFFALLLATVMLITLCACGAEEAKADKYCWNCGKGISKEVSFCSYCGASVKNNDADTDVSTEEGSTTSVTSTATTTSTTTKTSSMRTEAETTTKKQQTTTTQHPTTTTTKKATTPTKAPTTTTTKKTTATTQLADSITVQFPKAPLEVNTITMNMNTGKYGVSQTMRIDKFYYEIGSLDYLWLYCSGEKTYDIKGANSTASCEMNWRLYDLDGYLIDSGWFSVGRLKVGDKFKDQKINISLTGVKAGESYRLEVSDCSYE